MGALSVLGKLICDCSIHRVFDQCELAPTLRALAFHDRASFFCKRNQARRCHRTFHSSLSFGGCLRPLLTAWLFIIAQSLQITCSCLRCFHHVRAYASYMLAMC